jgi:dipeptidyl aminopeptidase/acylaminoacyl peptidase
MMRGPYWEDVGRWVAQSPLAKAAAFRTPMLLSIGVNDYRVPLNNALTMYAALQRQNIPTRLLVWTDENHWILKGPNSRRFYTEVSEWLGRYLR